MGGSSILRALLIFCLGSGHRLMLFLFDSWSFAIGAWRRAVGTLERVSERSLVVVARAFGDFADFAAFIKEKASSVLQAPCADVALRGVPLHIAKRRYHLPLAYMGDVAQRFRAEIG